MSFTCCKPLRVLWRQDLSGYLPPFMASGWVWGQPLFRFHGKVSGGDTGRELLRNGDAYARDLSKPLPSTAGPVVIENASEGIPFAEVTPCCSVDTYAALQGFCRATEGRRVLLDDPMSHSNAGAPARRCGRSDGAAYYFSEKDVAASSLHTLRMLSHIVETHGTILAGAEALQTGIPFQYTQQSITETQCYLAETLTRMERIASGGAATTRASTIQTSTRIADAVETNIGRVRKWALNRCLDFHDAYCSHGGCDFASDSVTDLPAPGVAMCSTPATFSVARGLQASATAIASGMCGATVWIPHPEAILSALWLIVFLREAAATYPGTTSAHFHVLLTGATSEHLLSPFCQYLAQTIPGGKGQPFLLFYGNNPTEKIHVAQELQRLRSSNVSFPLQSNGDLPSMCTCSLQASTPVVAFFPPSRSEDSITMQDVETRAAWLFRYALCPLTPLRDLPTTAVLLGKDQVERHDLLGSINNVNAKLEPHAFQVPVRWPMTSPSSSVSYASLSFIPRTMFVPLMRHLLQKHLGRCLRLGHSLDPTTEIGPCISAAHTHSVKEAIDRATVGHADVLWQQVCGGFELPLTVLRSDSNFMVPCVLYSAFPSTASNAKEGVQLICASVQGLLQPIEKQCGGSGGHLLFLCVYDDGDATVASSVQKAVTESTHELCIVGFP